MRIYDRFGRRIRNLRIIVTTRCNYRCIFCHSEGYYHCLRNKNEELDPHIIRLIGIVARRFGVDQVKITGGEPLLRRDIADIIAIFESLGYKDISIVTNGSLLREYASELKEAGLDRINISLPSLRESRYDYITQTSGYFRRVMAGIDEALSVGLNPVKINVVLLRGINDDEWMDFIRFGEEKGVHIQFIEFHTANPNSPEYMRFHRPLDDIEDYLRKVSIKMIRREMHARRKYRLESGIDIEIVSPMYNPEFCANCTRIRATPTGWKPCLLRDTVVEFGENIRDQRLLAKKFLEAISIREPFFT